MTAAPAEEGSDELTSADMEVLEFERLRWKYQGAKEGAVFERFGHGLTAYYVRLNQIVDKPGAEAYDPQLVHRIRRIRAARSAHRSTRIREQA